MVEWLVLELFLCPRDDKGFLLLTMLMLGVVAKTTNEMKGGKGLMMTCAAAASVMNYFRGLPGNAEYLGAYMYMCRIQLRGPVGCIGCFVPLMYRHVSMYLRSCNQAHVGDAPSFFLFLPFHSSFFFVPFHGVLMLRVDGPCAFTNGALLLARPFTARTALAIADIALDGAVSPTFRAVFHVCLVIWPDRGGGRG